MTMAQLSRDSLWTLEHYSRIRNQFRQEVMAHKKVRQVALGDHITLFFEDETRPAERFDWQWPGLGETGQQSEQCKAESFRLRQ